MAKSNATIEVARSSRDISANSQFSTGEVAPSVINFNGTVPLSRSGRVSLHPSRELRQQCISRLFLVSRTGLRVICNHMVSCSLPRPSQPRLCRRSGSEAGSLMAMTLKVCVAPASIRFPHSSSMSPTGENASGTYFRNSLS
jgi:hypothetical protein